MAHSMPRVSVGKGEALIFKQLNFKRHDIMTSLAPTTAETFVMAFAVCEDACVCCPEERENRSKVCKSLDTLVPVVGRGLQVTTSKTAI
jgi:hypothetical protein